MGFDIELQDEWGGTIESIGDPKNLLDKLLPPTADESHPILGAIDSYGNTVFNTVQIRWFLSEWREVLEKAQTEEEKALVARIESMARRVQDEVHLYLKFIGD